MRHYGFTVHDNIGTEIEDLGDAPLEDDEEAFAFGKGIIRDLMRESAEQYAGRTLDIIESRFVGSILFELDE